MTHHDGTDSGHDESTSAHEGIETESHLDDLEKKQDQREAEQTDESLGEEGLLPVPEGMPADGQAPGA